MPEVLIYFSSVQVSNRCSFILHSKKDSRFCLQFTDKNLQNCTLAFPADFPVFHLVEYRLSTKALDCSFLSFLPLMDKHKTNDTQE